mmetsp:Transcript_22257/g.69493  ORF Transcript_22257/g.69493 Transcript_22257/m.69493 type:complete len:362 (-) Transcript_22257:1195-2280(-)
MHEAELEEEVGRDGREDHCQTTQLLADALDEHERVHRLAKGHAPGHQSHRRPPAARKERAERIGGGPGEGQEEEQHEGSDAGLAREEAPGAPGAAQALEHAQGASGHAAAQLQAEGGGEEDDYKSVPGMRLTGLASVRGPRPPGTQRDCVRVVRLRPVPPRSLDAQGGVTRLFAEVKQEATLPNTHDVGPQELITVRDEMVEEPDQGHCAVGGHDPRHCPRTLQARHEAQGIAHAAALARDRRVHLLLGRARLHQVVRHVKEARLEVRLVHLQITPLAAVPARLGHEHRTAMHGTLNERPALHARSNPLELPSGVERADAPHAAREVDTEVHDLAWQEAGAQLANEAFQRSRAQLRETAHG